MKCVYCGKEIKDNSNFCVYCGKQIPKLPMMKKCIHCGKGITIESDYCTYCGKRQHQKGHCIYCDKEILEDAPFCPYCGKKQVQVYQYTFSRTEFSEDEFIHNINLWFAQHRSVANVKAAFDTGTRLGAFVNKAILNQVVIQYEVFQNGQNQYQYAVEDVSTMNLGIPGVTLNTAEDLLKYWKSNHPWAIVVNATGSRHSRGSASSLMFGGFMAANKNQVFVLYKFRPEDLPKEEIEQRALPEQN